MSSPGSSRNAHLCDKWVSCGTYGKTDLTQNFVSQCRIEKNYSGTSKICSGSFTLLECLSSLVA